MFPDKSLQNLMNDLLADPAKLVTYHLYKNNYTPVTGTLLGDLVESDFPGYAPLAAVVEPVATVDGSHEAVSLGNLLTWTCSLAPGTPQQAFGVYVTWVDNTSTVQLLRADELVTPVSIAFAGDQVNVKVDWYFQDYTP